MKWLPTKGLLKRLFFPSTLIIVIALFGATLKVGSYYSSDLLGEIVKAQTGDLYTISYDQLDINPWYGSIHLINAKLTPNLERIDSLGSSRRRVYDFVFKDLKIDLESIASIYFKRELVMEKIRIRDPVIQIINTGDPESQSFGSEAGVLYLGLEDYLKRLSIDSLRMVRGSIQHLPSLFEVANVNFYVHNSELMTSEGSSLLPGNVELEITDQQFFLQDSIHRISFEKLNLSTADSSLTFDNVLIEPIVEEGQDLEELVLFDLEIPKVGLKGLDYNSLYTNNWILIDEVMLQNSSIKINDQVVFNSKDSDVSRPLSQVITKTFGKLRIKKLGLINTQVDLQRSGSNVSPYQRITAAKSDIILHEVRMDSGALKKDSQLFEDIEIFIADYNSLLPDSIHSLQFDLLRYKTKDEILLFRNFGILNNGIGSDADQDVAIEIPLLKLSGLDYEELLASDQLNIARVEVDAPRLEIADRLRRRDTTKAQRLSPQAIYEMIKDSYRAVTIDQLSLRNGTLTGSDSLAIGQIDIALTQTRLNEEVNSWYDLFGKFSLQAKSISFRNEYLRLLGESIQMNESMKMDLSGWDIQLNTNERSASAKFDSLAVAGLNLDSVAINQAFVFDSLFLAKPELDILLQSSNSQVEEEPFIVNGFITVKDAKIRMEIANEAAFEIDTLNAFVLLDTIPYFQQANMKSLVFDQLKSDERWVVDELDFRQADELFIRDVWRFENYGQDTLQMDTGGYIRAIQLVNFKPEELFIANKLAADRMTLEVAMFNFQSPSNEDSTAAKRPTYEIQIDEVAVYADSLLFQNPSNTIEELRLANSVLNLDGFHYPRDSSLGAEHLLYSEDVQVAIGQVLPAFNTEDSLSFSNVSLDYAVGAFALDSFYYEQKGGADRLSFHRLELDGIDFSRLRTDSTFAVDSILLHQPTVAYSLDELPSNSEPANSWVDRIELGYFSTSGAEIDLIPVSGQPYSIHDGEITIQALKVAPGFDGADLLTNTGSFTVSGNDFSYDLPDSYQLNVESYQLYYPNKEASLQGITYRSALSAEEYSRNLTYQKDWVDLSIDEVQAQNIGLEELFQNQSFGIDKLFLSGAEATLYRDKAIPFPPDQVKDLPQTMLQDIERAFRIDTLQVNGSVTYQEKPDASDQVGEISFDNLDVTVLDITNVRDSMVLQPIYLSGSGEIMEVAPFNLTATFYGDSLDSFELIGEVSEFPLESLNKMLVPVANVNIASGLSKEIAFVINADKNEARGMMEARYNRLKIQFLKENANMGFKTFIANAFIIHKNNPRLLKFRKGEIYANRDTSRFIVNYWSKALLSGAIRSIGVKSKEKRAK